MMNKLMLIVLCAFGMTVHAISPKEEYEILSLEQVSAKSIENIDSVEIHYIAKVNSNFVELTDGTQLDVGFWWRGIVKSWNPGDAVMVAYRPYNAFCAFKMYNLTQDTVVWGKGFVFHLPVIGSPETHWIASIEDNHIELNEGSKFELEVQSTKCGAGDIVFIMSNDNPKAEYPFWLWNFSAGGIYSCKKL